MALLRVTSVLVLAALASADIYGTVDINEASREGNVALLDSLWGVGASTANKIITEYAESGPYSSAEDLARVNGISDDTVVKMKHYASFSRRRNNRMPIVVTTTTTTTTEAPTTSTTQAPDLSAEEALKRVFISEYVEGSFNRKAIELYNPTKQAVSLNDARLQWHHNGKDYAAAENRGAPLNGGNYDLPLQGLTIGAGSTFVICRKGRDAVPTDTCDLEVDYDSTASHAVLHNGDDAIELLVNGVRTDIIGVVGTRPESCWRNREGACITKDITISRKVNAGSTRFDSDQWVVSEKDAIDGLGSAPKQTVCKYHRVDADQCVERRIIRAFVPQSSGCDILTPQLAIDDCQPMVGLTAASCREFCDVTRACTRVRWVDGRCELYDDAATRRRRLSLVEAGDEVFAPTVEGDVTHRHAEAPACFQKDAEQCEQRAFQPTSDKMVPQEWVPLGGADMCVGSAHEQYLEKKPRCTLQAAKANCQGDLRCFGFVIGFRTPENGNTCYFLSKEQHDRCGAVYPMQQGPNFHKANGYVLVRAHPFTTCHYDNQYESKAATRTSDRECKKLTECDFETHYESIKPTPTSNRGCSELTPCKAVGVEYETRPKTQTSDRKCAPVTDCDYSTEYEFAAPTSTSQRVCKPISTCAAGFIMTREHTRTSNTVCEMCSSDFEFKAAAGNDRTCTACPTGQKAHDDHRSCYAYMCDHTFCEEEEHTCYSSNRENFADPQHRTWYEEKHWDECDGSKFKSIRVYHKGRQEVNCAAGHHCAKGTVSGDTKKCECKPLAKAQKLLMPWEL